MHKNLHQQCQLRVQVYLQDFGHVFSGGTVFVNNKSHCLSVKMWILQRETRMEWFGMVVGTKLFPSL